MHTSKIKSVTKLNKSQTYNVHMKSVYHNFTIDDKSPVFANSHAAQYITIAYVCAWLKNYYPQEWWASVMSQCSRKDLINFIGVARKEGIIFKNIEVNNLSLGFSVNKDDLSITPGLKTIEKFGDSMVNKIINCGIAKFNDVDEFILHTKSNKTIMERLIKLNAFSKLHSNSRALLMWYCYKYQNDKDLISSINNKLIELDGWNDKTIKDEIARQIEAFKKLKPKTKIIPKKILNWKPKPDATREKVMALFPDDFSIKEKLGFEKEFLQFYWSSPMTMFNHNPEFSIINCSDMKQYVIDCCIDDIEYRTTKSGSKFGIISINDGLATSRVYIWQETVSLYENILKPGIGIRLKVKYDAERKSFTILNNSHIIFLQQRSDGDTLQIVPDEDDDRVTVS